MSLDLAPSGSPSGCKARQGTRGQGSRLLREHGVVVALLALLVFNAAFTPNFLQLQTLFVNISQVATIAIVAVGMTLVIATGGIDLSVGAVMALAGALAPLIFGSALGLAHPELGLALAIALPLLAAAACGLFNGVMVSLLGVQPIIATLILFISGRGIALVLTNGNLQTFSNPAFSYLGTGRVMGLPFQGWLAIAIALVVAWVVGRTLFGRYLLALGGNERAARLAGVPVRAVKIGAYVICAVRRRADRRRHQLGLGCGAHRQPDGAGRHRRRGRRRCRAAGRPGTDHGRLLGALVIQLVKYTLLANGVEDEVALIVKALIIVVAVYLQSMRRS